MKNVLITGGAKGLGNYLVKTFLQRGFNVAFTYNNTPPNTDDLDAAITDNNTYLPVRCDLRDKDDIANLVKEVLMKFETVDVLINNAAYESNKEFDEKTKEDFLQTLDVNVVAPFLLSRAIAKNMYENKKGVIINVSSDNSIDKYDPISLEYDASKAALNSVTHNLAKQYAPHVRVNAIAPNWIKTQRITDLNDSLDGKFIEEGKKNNLLNKIATEEDIANLVLFLASDASSYINSEVIRIDGGNK